MINGKPVKTALLMAAGLGKRMRPLTSTRPQPLVKVAGKPLLAHALDRLEAGGIENVFINVHSMPDTFIAHVKPRNTPMKHLIFDERDRLLQPRGGLVNALHRMGE